MAKTDKTDLEASLRGNEKKSDKTALRNSGLIPAVIYGKGFKNLIVSVDPKKLNKLITGSLGRNIIISLNIAEGDKVKTVPVLTHVIQRDPMSDRIIHVDFMHVEMKKELKTKVKLELVGVATGVKDDGGILVPGLREIEVKCLPTAIPEKFTIDVSAMKINDTLHVSDLKAMEGVEIISPKEETLVHISPPAKEEELAPAAPISAAEVPSEKGAPVAVEVPAAEGGKKEEKKAPAAAPGAAPAKGAAPAQAAPAKGAAPAAPAKPEKK